MSIFLSINQLCKDIGDKNLLYNLDLKISKGSINALLGLCGNGKEKLFEILTGRDCASSGGISFDGKPFSPANIRDALKAGIIMISENAGTIPDLTVKDNLIIGLQNRPAKSDIISAMKQVKLDDLPLNTLCRSLTLSQSLRILLARAILSKAKLYLFNQLDCAFSKDDRNIYYSIMRNLKNTGGTVIFIPSIIEDLLFVDNYYAIHNGSIIKCESNLQEFTASVFTDEGESIFPPQLSSRSNTIIMESLGLKGRELKDASVNIREKEVCGIYGLKGSGINDLISILIGKYTSTGGVLSVCKNNLQARRITPSRRHKAGIEIFNGRLNHKMSYDSRNIHLRSLTGNIIVMIDPAYGLDLKDRKNFYNLINELKLQNKAIILYTSSLEELKGISDTIAIIFNGELSATRSKDNWTNEEIYKYVTSGKLEAFSIL